jgi:hypothetical protein
VLPGGVELGDLRRDGGEEAERERREPERPEDDEEDEESELADPPPLRAARFSPEERQDRGSLALHVPDELTRNAVDLLPEGGLEAKLSSAGRCG